MTAGDRRPVMVVGGESSSADGLVDRLRGMGRIAVWMESCDTALEMMQVFDFAAVIVNLDDPSVWETCLRVATEAACPVAVITPYLARDRRFRDRAFQAGAAAYVCRSCARRRLREVLCRLRAGERGLEMVDGAPFRES